MDGNISPSYKKWNSLLSAGQWIHLTILYNKTSREYSLYKNGIFVAQNENVIVHPSSLNQERTILFLGKSSNGTDGYF